MGEVGKPSGLTKRKNGVWYFRKRWPKRFLQDGESRSDFVRSTNTSDYEEAISLVVALQLEAERYFQTESSKTAQSGIVPKSRLATRPVRRQSIWHKFELGLAERLPRFVG